MHTPELPGQLPWSTRLMTRWSDEDNQGVLNNAVTLTLCEEARRAFCLERGLLQDNQFPFLLGACNLRFARPGTGGVEVVVQLGVTRVGASSAETVYRVLGPDGALWSEAEALLVTYDPATMRPCPHAPRLREAWESLLLPPPR